MIPLCYYIRESVTSVENSTNSATPNILWSPPESTRIWGAHLNLESVGLMTDSLCMLMNSGNPSYVLLHDEALSGPLATNGAHGLPVRWVIQ